MEDNQHLGQTTKDKEDNNNDIIRPIAENNTQNYVQPMATASYTSDSRPPGPIPNGTTAPHTKPSNNNTTSISVMGNVNVMPKPSLTTTAAAAASLSLSTAVASTTMMTSAETRLLPTNSSHTITTTTSTPSDKPYNVNVNAVAAAAAGNSTVSSSSSLSASLPTPSSKPLPSTATATIIQKRKAVEPPPPSASSLYANGDNNEMIKLNKEEKSLPTIATKKQKMDDDESASKTRMTTSGDNMILSTTTATVQERKNNDNSKNNNVVVPNINSTSFSIISDSRKQNEQKKEDDGNVPSEEKKKIITATATATATTTLGMKNKNTQVETLPAAAAAVPSLSLSATGVGVGIVESPKPPPQVAAAVASTKKKENDGTEVVRLYTTFPTLKKMSDSDIHPLRSLSTAERIQLERLFEFDNRANDETWPEHFMDVVALTNDNVVENPDGRDGERSKKRTLLDWVGINTDINDVSTDNNNGGSSTVSISNNSLDLISHVLRHVYNYKKIPKQAKLILANIDMNSPRSIAEAIGRLSIDPIVLQQDGWTTMKASEPMGASGGAYRIGEKIWWEGYVGVVIAFVHDNDIGDLWKGMWIEDLKPFDLEPEELANSRKKYERKKAAQSSSDQKRKLIKNTAKVEFEVDGIEHGIILATSFARGARPGVFWPARVMHASELVGAQNKRGRNKKKVDVVFLAPYWNSNHTMMKSGGGGGGGRRVEALSDSVVRHGEALFSSGPLFEVEIIDADDTSIERYPYDVESGLDIDSLRLSFKLMGLPKDAFSRFLDSHRLALGFRTFSQFEMKSTRASDSDRASTALLEGHPLAVHTAHFPASALQLPFIHMLSQLPHHEKQTFRPKTYPGDMAKGEPALQFGRILDSMKPPACWGLNSDGTSEVKESPQFYSTVSSPISFSRKGKGSKDDPYDTGRFIVGLSSLHSLLSENSPTSNILKNSLNELVIADAKCSSLQQLHGSEARKKYLRSMNRTWIIVKVSLV
jgi:hypothetical protein